MAKRQTRTNADTLDNVRRQAEERGRALGRQDLAVELMNMIAVPETPERLHNLYHWLMGRNSKDDYERVTVEGERSLLLAMSVLARITEEANTPAF